MELKFNNINQSLIGMSKELLKNGVKRETRGFICYELLEPVTIKIENPSDRHIIIKDRKQNKFLPFVETLWIMSGVNDLEMPGSYVKNLYTYSDDGQFMRAAYSPRIRCYTGNYSDYKISEPKHRNVFGGGTMVVDQLKYVIESFKRDNFSRQLMIEIGDPAKDCFNTDGDLKVTKDYPCTRLLNFQLRENKLDLTVYMRSNDHWFGAHSVNITNFTFIQEIVANILGVEVGTYYHVVNNYHFYDNFRPNLELISQYDISSYHEQEKFFYNDKIQSLEHFDNLIETLFDYEKGLRIAKRDYRVDLGVDMFNDWAKVFYHYWTKNKIEFKNPHLNCLFYD